MSSSRPRKIADAVKSRLPSAKSIAQSGNALQAVISLGMVIGATVISAIHDLTKDDGFQADVFAAVDLIWEEWVVPIDWPGVPQGIESTLENAVLRSIKETIRLTLAGS